MGDSLPSLMPRTRLSEGAGRIDRVAWRAGTCVMAHGVRLGVRTNAPAILARLESCLPPGWRPSRSALVDEVFSVWVDPADAATRPSRVYVGPRRRARTRDLRQALGVLETELRQSLAARSRQRTFVHAGVVGWRGQAIVVPGRSRSGKTTLVAELVRAGATLPLGRVRHHRFARASAPVREAALDPRGGRLRSPRQPPERRGPGRNERHAAAPDRPRRARQPRARGRVAAANAHERPGRDRDARSHGAGEAAASASLQALERAVGRATVVKGQRGEAKVVARRLLQLVESLENGHASSADQSHHRRTR